MYSTLSMGGAKDTVGGAKGTVGGAKDTVGGAKDSLTLTGTTVFQENIESMIINKILF